MDLAISDEALEVVRSKGGTAAIDYIQPIGWGGTEEVSVDTYLKGKNTTAYRRIHHEDITILVAKPLMQYASKVELVTRRKLLGAKLMALAHHQHTSACRH